MTMITTTDYHTAGEPFRIVTAGVAVPRGATVPDRRRWAMEHLDDVRSLLCREPRGHADMYGGFVTPPDDDDGDLGTVFFHNDGFSTACGHGTIALATWAIDSGLIDATRIPDGDEVTVTIDVPSGRVRAAVTMAGGRANTVRFHNVPAHAHHLGVELACDGRRVTVDVGYGGAFYAMLDVATLGLSVAPEDLSQLIAHARSIKAAAGEQLDLTLPDASGDRGLYGVIFHEPLGPAHQRNVTVFADGQVDRSPCGSGTSARLAVLAERGDLQIGQPFTHDSVIGTRFVGRVLGELEPRDGVRRWDTEMQGRASRTGHHTFVVEPDDELRDGFNLR